MRTTRLPLAVVVATAALTTAAAAAGIQDDIEACGAAAVEAGLIGADGTSLRFVSDEGNRNRTLTLKALNGDTAPVVLECRMKRSEVLEVVRADG